MQQSRQGQGKGGARTQKLQHAQHMVPQVAVRLVRRALRQTFHRQQFRQNGPGQAKFQEQVHAAGPVWRQQQFPQLLGNPLRAHNQDLPGHRGNRHRRRRFHGEIETRGDAHGAEHAQLVLGKAHGRLADRAQNLPLQVRLSADIIDELVLQRIEEHAVDGEISPQRVFAG